MIDESLFSHMQNFGLTQYEAKAYAALLSIGTSNAYKVSKASEIPRTRIYDILDSLTNRGIVMLEETNAGTKKYTALPARVFLEQAREKWFATYSHVEKELKAIESENNQAIYVSTVKGEQNILAFCRNLLHEAKQRVIISIWAPMYAELLSDLQDCMERGCSVRGITFEVDHPLSTLDNHRMNKSHHSPDNKKWFILSVDGKKLLYGHSSEHNGNAFYTADPVHIYLLEDYIFHDVLVNRVIEKENNQKVATQILSDILAEMKINF